MLANHNYQRHVNRAEMILVKIEGALTWHRCGELYAGGVMECVPGRDGLLQIS